MEVKKETFDNVVQVRLGEDLLSRIDEYIRLKPEVFVSRSHFFRAAAIKLMRQEK